MHDDPYIAKLRAMKPRFAGMNIKRLRVFGSRARGDATPESDIDLLVDFIAPPGWNYAGLQRQIQEELQIPVHLITLGCLKHPKIRDSILEDAQDV